MRAGRWSWLQLLALLSLAVGLTIAQQQQQLFDGDALNREGEGDGEAVRDVCHPLQEAQTIIALLQPAPNAHLVNKLGPLADSSAKGWRDRFTHIRETPITTAARYFDRFVRTIHPVTLVKSVLTSSQKRKGAIKTSRWRREQVERLLGLIEQAEQDGCTEALVVRARLRMFPPKGVRQDLAAAYAAFERVLETTSDPEAQFFVGFFHATGLGGIKRDQGKATLYYTFSALQGYRPAEMAMGYRHWAGIGVKEECLLALDWYEAAAQRAYSNFLAGPPGGRTFPYTSTRLSDRYGGIFGPHASWASTGANAHRAASRAFTASSRGETEREILEYYQYHSDRDSYLYTVRLGRLYYLGSVYHLAGHGAEGVGEIPQDYKKAREYFLRAARQWWPTDFDNEGKVTKKRKMSKEQEAELRGPAMVAAAHLGRMAMRGEGQKRDYKRARMWYERASELGDAEAHNGLGVMHRDGLLTPPDINKAYAYFSAAAGSDLGDAQVNLAKIHIDRGEVVQAQALLEAAIGNQNAFEAFHLLASLHSTAARLGTQRGACGVSAAWFKIAAEKGNWDDDYIGDADRAWLRGEEEKALLGWWIAAEMGYEAGQNNVAFALEKGVGRESAWVVEAVRAGGADAWGGDAREGKKDKENGAVKRGDDGTGEQVGELGLEMWIRSAAQDNVDAMVKVGDYYYSGVGGADEARYARAANYYQTAADTQMSAMAYWNLGWMYEMGKGVPRDWHLAKRNYDLSMETNLEAQLPAMLSLVGLYLRSWWVEIQTRGAVPGLSLFEEEPTQHPIEHLGIWAQIKALFTPLGWDEYDAAYDPYVERAGDQHGHAHGHDQAGAGPGAGAGGGDEGYNDYSGAGSGWLTNDRDRDREYDYDDYNANGGADEDLIRRRQQARLDIEEAEDLVESIAVLALLGLIAGLVAIRARWAERERRQRVEREARERVVRAQMTDHAERQEREVLERRQRQQQEEQEQQQQVLHEEGELQEHGHDRGQGQGRGEAGVAAPAPAPTSEDGWDGAGWEPAWQ